MYTYKYNSIPDKLNKDAWGRISCFHLGTFMGGVIEAQGTSLCFTSPCFYPVPLLQYLCHKHAIWVFFIVAKWLAVLEAVFFVELPCGGECVH